MIVGPVLTSVTMITAEAGSDPRARFLALGTVGQALSEDRFLGGFPWDCPRCWGRMRYRVASGFRGVRPLASESPHPALPPQLH